MGCVDHSVEDEGDEFLVLCRPICDDFSRDAASMVDNEGYRQRMDRMVRMAREREPFLVDTPGARRPILLQAMVTHMKDREREIAEFLVDVVGRYPGWRSQAIREHVACLHPSHEGRGVFR